MNVYKLSFGKITILKNNLAEVVVDEGVVFNDLMVDEYHDFLLTNLNAPFSLLINKKHPYSYTFSAQRKIANLEEIKAIAVVVHTSGGVMSTETLVSVNENNKWKLKLFQERAAALRWLENDSPIKPPQTF